MFGYDEVEDLIHVKRIAFNKDLVVIGKAIYGDPNIRHGVLSYYFMAPAAILFHQDPSGIALWNGLFNLFTAVVVYFIAKSIFKDPRISITATVLYVFSYLAVEYSGWVCHPVFAPLFVSLFFLGIWKLVEEKPWGLFMSLTFMGLAIQSDLMFVYLLPIFILYFFIFRPKYPGLKMIFLSLASFFLTTATIIYTELKFNFSGVRTVLHFSANFEEGRSSFFERFSLFLQKFFEMFADNVIPEQPKLSLFIAIFTVLIIIISLLKSKKTERLKIGFLLLYLFSSAVTLFIGFHNKPWSFIGILPAVSLAMSYVVVKLRKNILIVMVVMLITYFNLQEVFELKENNKLFMAVPKSSFLSSQLKVIDYTYQSSEGKRFALDAVTYPLYVNTYWSYDYPWYGIKKYGYLPTWSGSQQLYPHNSLVPATGKEDYVYLIIDDTPDIPSWAKLEAKRYWDTKSLIIEEKEIGGFIVQKRKL
jgi:4-amino-4-deoxy-L-arabinose transferase-like glycosyltransferase